MVDSRLDEALQEILTRVSQPPLVQNPYPAVVERLRGAGHQADVSLHLDGSEGGGDGGAGGGGKSSSSSLKSDRPPLRGRTVTPGCVRVATWSGPCWVSSLQLNRYFYRCKITL